MSCSRVIVFMCCIAPAAAFAVPVQSSVGTFLTGRTCIAGPNGPCEFISPLITPPTQYGGAPGDLSTTTSLDIDGFGTWESSISLSGVAGAPVIATSAHADAGARINTTSFALQRYVYDGSVATTRTFGGTLNYLQSITEPNNALYVDSGTGGTASGLYSRILIFTSSDLFAEAGSTSESNFNNLQHFALGAATDYALLGQSEFFDASLNVPSGTANVSVTLNLNPGDAFWIYTYLQTPASNGSIVETSTPFVPRWDDASGLTPANVTSVPEPNALALMLTGIVATFAAPRKRRA